MNFWSQRHPALNDLSIDDAHGSCHPIDLDDIDEEATESKLKIPNVRGKQKGKKIAKCWNFFKLVSTDLTVDEVQECKSMCKYCETRLVCQKKIDTTHLNYYYVKSMIKHGLGGTWTQM